MVQTIKSNIKKRKICVVIASRANYARIKSLLKAIRDSEEMELQLILTGSALLKRFGNIDSLVQGDGFSIAERVYYVVEGENPLTMAKSTGLAIIELATSFGNLKPDIVLTVADRHETLATAVAANYMNIYLAHTQGGEVTGSVDESVRHAITKLSHFHFVATGKSGDRVIQMGENPNQVFHTGCPSIDLLNETQLSFPNDFFNNNNAVGHRFDSNKPYLLVVQHPVTTEYGSHKDQIKETISAVKKTEMNAVWLWPNADAGSEHIAHELRDIRENEESLKIQFVINLSPEVYARVLNQCACIVGNSSSGIREGAYLGVPAVNIGSRQLGRERGENVIDAKYNSESIFNAIQKQIGHGRFPKNNLFGDGMAGIKICEILKTCKAPIQKKFHHSELAFN